MKKKIVAMLLIACMSISAAACGKSEEPKEKVKTEAQKETKEKKEYQKIGVESAEAFDVLYYASQLHFLQEFHLLKSFS